jgi:hypothetical protein
LDGELMADDLKPAARTRLPRGRQPYDDEAKARLETARAQFKTIIEWDEAIRNRLKSDHEYVDGVATDPTTGATIGKRWTTSQRDARKGRPTLEIDALSGPLMQVENAISESRPAANMAPVGGGADPMKAEVWNGLMRRIQTTPEAELAAVYAAGHLVKIGRGAWLLREEYPEYNGNPDDAANWEKEIVRDWIDNQHEVYAGPATRPDGSDRQYAFVLQTLTKEQFDARFGEGQFDENHDAFGNLGDGAMAAWSTKDSIIVATWYRLKAGADVTITRRKPDGTAETRTVRPKVCCQSTITATHEYEYAELPIPYVPLIVGQANYVNVAGERDVRGMARRARDPQNMLNAYASYIPETIARAGRQEVWVAVGQDAGLDPGNFDLSRRVPFRRYHALEINGKLVGPPQVETFEAPIQAMSLALQQAEQQVRKSLLYFDADTDESGAERSKISGVAMKRRQQAGELGNSHFMRAYKFMIHLEIKILQAWIPHVYDTPRVLRIVGADDEEFTAITHFGAEHEAAAAELQAGLQYQQGGQMVLPDTLRGIYDLSTGRYDVKPDVSPNPLTQRQETVEVLREVIPALPPEMQVKAFPVFLESIDGPAGRKLRNIFDPKKQQEQGPSPEEWQAAKQMMQKLSEELEKAHAELESKDADRENQRAIEQMKIEGELKQEEIKQQYALEGKKVDAMATVRAAALQPDPAPAMGAM